MMDSLTEILRRILHIERRIDRLESLETPTIGGGGGIPGAPNDAQYVTLALDAGLTAERVLTEGPDIDIVDSGANMPVTVGRGGDSILLFDSGGNPLAEFPAIEPGVLLALAAATPGDIIECPRAITIPLTAGITIPASVTFRNANLSFSGFAGVCVTLSLGSVIENFNISGDGVGFASMVGLAATGIDTASILVGNVLVQNATTNVGIDLSGTSQYIHCTLAYGDARGGTTAIGIRLADNVMCKYSQGNAIYATTNIGVQFNIASALDTGYFGWGWGKGTTNTAYGMQVSGGNYGTIMHSWCSGATAGLRIEAGGTAKVFGVEWSSLSNAGTITYLPGDRSTGAGLGWFVVTDYGAVGNGIADDTIAIQNTINAAEAAGGGIVYFPAGVYIVGGALQDGARGNAQLLIPDIDTTGKQIPITLLGESEPAVVPSLTGVITLPDGGSIIKGTLNAGAGGALLGGWGPVGSFGDFTLVNLRIENLAFQMPDNPVLTALNLDHIVSVELVNVVCSTGNYRVSTVTEPTTNTSYGIKTPKNSNGAWTFIRELLVVGFYNGLQINEHTNADHISFFACKYAGVLPVAGHAARLGRVLVVWCKNGLQFTGAHHLTIELYNVEHHNPTAAWYDNVLDIDDGGNNGLGFITYHATISGTGADDPLVVNGGTNLHIRKLEDGIGAESLATTTVIPGPYTNTDLTVDAYGRITAAANGAAGAIALDDLSDVDIAGSGTGDILYNNAGTWEDYPLGIASNITNDGDHIRIGDIVGGDYVEINTDDGSVRLRGDATAWDDLLFPASVVKPGATAPAYKAFGPSGSLQALMFEAGHNDEVYFEVQLSHRWKEGSKIYPHVHWTPTTADAGNVVWELEYSWANIDGTFGAPSNMASEATAAGGTAWVHKLTMLKEAGNAYIDGTGKTMSSMLVCRLHRNSNAGSDTLNKDVAMLDVDFHIEIDSFGSDEEYTKDAVPLLLLESGDLLLLETGDRIIL